jgi:hypothetical protein
MRSPCASRLTVVELIAATTTTTGLRVRCELDTRCYPTGIKVSHAETDTLDIKGDKFHPERDYVIKQLGSGVRHIPRLREYYNRIFKGLMADKGLDEIQAEFANDTDFAFLTAQRPRDARPESTTERKAFNRGTKTAAFFEAALPAGARCRIYGALIHKNSIQFDHVVAKRDRGAADMSNAQVSHPFCNSIKDHLSEKIFSSSEAFATGGVT